MARVATQLSLKASADFLRDKALYLEIEVSKRTREVMAIQGVTILAMASLAETRDSDTGNHIRRTQYYVKALADKLKSHPRFASFLAEQNIRMLFKSAPLHDIGKVGIPDRILLKPGKFDEAEFEIMKTHAALGRDAIQSAEDQLGLKVEFLAMAKDFAYGHQEKWDGRGYPTGLAGDAIPIPARLMAVADVYDALISRRVYKEGMSHEKAVQIIRRIAVMVQRTFAVKNLTISVATPHAVADDELLALGDSMLCYSLFQNLLKNACEAAPDDSTVTVTIYGGAPMRITLDNQGVVPAAIRNTFFEKFATAGKQGGTGLGTYSAKLLAEAQNGTIAMETSDEKNQTRITLTFPAE
jgi:hypothetical protein